MAVAAGYDLGGDDVAFEVHQVGTGVGPLWTNTWWVGYGSLSKRTGPWHYDNGLNPAAGYSGYEVHQAGTGVGQLWSEYFGYLPVPFIH